MSGPLKVLIVGVGQIGMAAARALVRVGADVHLLDCAPRKEFLARYLPTVKPRNMLLIDFSEVEAVSRYIHKQAIDIVVFSAGFSSRLVNGDPNVTHNLFSVDLDNLMAAACDSGARKVVAMSSLAVYDRSASHAMLDETSALNTQSSYARAHLALESTLARWRARINVVVLRLAGVFGAHPAGKGSSSTLLMERLLLAASSNRALIVEGYPDDADDIIFSGQVGEVVSSLALNPATRSETFNVARDSVVTLQQICDAMHTLFRSTPIRIAPPVTGRTVARRPAMTSKKLRESCGIDLRRPIRDDVIDYAAMLGLPVARL